MRSGALRPALRAWRPLLLFAVLEMAGPWFLLAHAERDLSSSLTGLLVAAVPLVAAVAGRALGESDRLDRTRVAGLLRRASPASRSCSASTCAAATSLAVGAVGADRRRLRPRPAGDQPLPARRAEPGRQRRRAAVTAVLFSGPPRATYDGLPSGRCCSPSSRWAWSARRSRSCCSSRSSPRSGPNRALVITFVNPAVAVTLGILLLAEPFTAGTAVGFPLVLAGCVLATRRSAPAPVAAGEPARA